MKKRERSNATWAVILLLGILLLFAGCVTSGGGLVTPNLVDDEKVRKMSAEQFEQIKKTSRLTRSPRYVEQVNRVMDQLATQVNWWEFSADWEIIIIDNSKSINAFAMAGGKIGVYTGLLDIVENDDQLAFVLAHEISHVTEKHVHKKVIRVDD
jgi:predicted Zn-dependent protease